MTAHDDFEEILSGLQRELFEPHVVEDEEIGFEIAGEGLRLIADGLGLHELGDGVEDRAVEDDEAHAGRLMADTLGEVALADPRGSEEEDVAVFPDEAAGGELHDLASIDRGVEAEVEVFDRASIAEAGGLDAPGDGAIVADGELVGDDELEELGVTQAVSLGLLDPHLEAREKPRETKTPEVLGKLRVHADHLLSSGSKRRSS